MRTEFTGTAIGRKFKHLKGFKYHYTFQTAGGKMASQPVSMAVE